MDSYVRTDADLAELVGTLRRDGGAQPLVAVDTEAASFGVQLLGLHSPATVASHLPNFAKRRDDVEFVGVARKGRELLQKIRDDWGFEVASEDYRDVIEAGIDICLVASPTAAWRAVWSCRPRPR